MQLVGDTTRKLIGRLARDARRAPERWLHAFRRRAACRRLSSLRPHVVLVICRGNICRSPFAHAYLRAITSKWALPPVVRSAGFLAAGRSAPPEALAAAAEFSVALEQHRSASLTLKDLEDADVVLVMDLAQKRAIEAISPHARHQILLLGDFDPVTRIPLRTVHDPVGGDTDAFRVCYRRIARCLRVFADHLPGAGPASRDEPERMGPLSAGRA